MLQVLLVNSQQFLFSFVFIPIISVVNGLNSHNLNQFSTKDKGPRKSCATSKLAGWWYGTYDGCNGYSNLLAPKYQAPNDTWNWSNFAHWRASGQQNETAIYKVMMGFRKKGEFSRIKEALIINVILILQIHPVL